MIKATRLEHIQPFHVMELLARARTMESEGRDVVHMEVGEPDFSTPPAIVAAAQQALEQGKTHYTPASGLPELRQALAGFYRQRYGVELDARRIIITPGASGALLLTLGAMLNEGDEVLMADPGYPCNRHFVSFLNAVPRPLPVGPDSHFQLQTSHIKEHWGKRTRAVMLASPSNPTGTCLANEELTAIAEQVHRRGGGLLMDEIYHGLVYGRDLETAVKLPGDVYVVNSFSKYFCMTGWRLGWVVVPEAMVDEVEKLAQNLFIAAPTLAQHAALAAFSDETLAVLEERRQIFAERRDFLLQGLQELGLDVPVVPDGAFYCYADISALGMDSYPFAMKLLEEEGVAVTPGLDFGSHHPERYLRFAFTTSQERLAEGLRRLQAFMERL